MPTATKPMCPWSDCGQAIKRRSKGCCPHCRRPVYYLNGFTSTEERPALSVELWHLFVRLKQRQTGYLIELHPASKDYRMELGFAITFLKRCGGDIDLASETMRQLFQLYPWKTRDSILHLLGKDFRTGLAAAKKVINQQKTEEAIVVRSMARTVIKVPMPTFSV